MSDEQSIRDELVQDIAAALLAKINRPPNAGMVTHLTDAILASPVIRRIQAEAIREAAEALNEKFQDIPAWVEAYQEGVRTDEWMQGGVRMVMSATDVLRSRADRIEQNSEGNET